MKKRAIIVLAVFVAAALIGTAVFFTVKNAAAQNASNKTEKKESQQVREEEHITSAVEFLSRDDVIIPLSELPESIGKAGSDRIINYMGHDYYFGYTANMVGGLNAMLILTEEQSRELLTAPDISEISYFQSECLVHMLRWRRVYADYFPGNMAQNRLDVRRIAYYYFDDRIVIVVCGCELCPVNMTRARITVITDAEKESCPFLIPAENGEKEPEGTYYQSYRDYVISFYDDFNDFYAQNVLGWPENWKESYETQPE